MMTIDQPWPWLSLKEVTRILACSKTHVATLVRDGVIRRRMTSAHKRYYREDVEKLARSQQVISVT